jgi:pimeloyl-ACP methyl ester carboxylesterase
MESREFPFGSAHLHVADFGGSRGPTFLLVHGLGGSHANFAALAPLLAPHGRVLAVDLPGFGLSPPGDGSHMEAHDAAVARVIDLVRSGTFAGASAPVVLVGNSMGGVVVIHYAARRPADVRALCLVCPALPQRDPRVLDRRFTSVLALSLLPGYERLFRRRLRAIGPEGMLRELLQMICADPSRVPAHAMEAMEAIARRRVTFEWSASAFQQSARSVVWTVFRGRAYEDVMRSVRAPVLLLHGERDRSVPVASARAIAAKMPHWRFEVFEDVGHVPQLEAPERTARALLAFAASAEAETTARA